MLAPMTGGQSTSADPRTGRDRRSKTFAIAAVALLVAAAGLGIWWMAGAGKRDAVRECEESVRGHIGYPAAVRFTINNATLSGSIWQIDGHADSDKRYAFDCTVDVTLVTAVNVH